MRVLVTAASKHGSTDAVARTIGAELELAGLEVDVRHPADIDAIDRYDVVILGSAVYLGRWMPAALGFVDRFAEPLAERRVWIFSSGPIGDPPILLDDALDVARVRTRTGAIDHRVFAGRLDPQQLGLAERAVMASIDAEAGDFRSWPEIRDWALEIAAHLAEPAVSSRGRVAEWQTRRP